MINLEDKLEELKTMIDEDTYPYFEDEYLLSRLEGNTSIKSLARELCIVKSGIEGIKLGDVDIPSPKTYFLTLASQYRSSQTGMVVRADGRE